MSVFTVKRGPYVITRASLITSFISLAPEDYCEIYAFRSVCLAVRTRNSKHISPIYLFVLHKKCYTHASVSSKMIGIGIGIRNRDVFRSIHHWEIGQNTP